MCCRMVSTTMMMMMMMMMMMTMMMMMMMTTTLFLFLFLRFDVFQVREKPFQARTLSYLQQASVASEVASARVCFQLALVNLASGAPVWPTLWRARPR